MPEGGSILEVKQKINLGVHDIVTRYVDGKGFEEKDED